MLPPEKILTTAVFKVDHFTHFGIHRSLANIYSVSVSEIQDLEMKISDNQIRPVLDEVITKPDYWGYFDVRENRFTQIWPSLMQVRMCFPYGLDIMEKHGHGMAYRLEIVSHKQSGTAL